MRTRLPRRLELVEETARLRAQDLAEQHSRLEAIDPFALEGALDYMLGRPWNRNPYSREFVADEHERWSAGWESAARRAFPAWARGEYRYTRSQGWSMPWERDDSWTPDPAA